MGKINSGWVRRRAAVLLSASVVLSSVMVAPAMAVEVGEDVPAVEAKAEDDSEPFENTPVEKAETAEAEETPIVTTTGTEKAAPQAEGAAVIVSADGQTTTGYATAKDAAGALKDEETLVLNEDYTAEWGLSVKAANVTIDLNGHSIFSTKSTTSASNGYAINIKKPVSGAVTHTVKIKNSSQKQAVLSSSAYQIVATSGDSNATLTVAIEGNIALASTSGTSALGVNLGTGSRMADSAAARSALPNGGFLVHSSEGNAYLYGSFSNAAKAANGDVVTLLHNYEGSEPINSGSADAVLDLGGHTYTYTGGQAIATVNYDNASLILSNGSLVGVNTSADGIRMLYSGSSLVLDGISVSVSGQTYGIVTNGTKTNNTITLRNSSLNVPDGYGIYFPSTGSVTIDQVLITAKFTGVQMCAGSLTVKGEETSITVTGQPQGKTEDDGVISDGAAISIVEREGYQELGLVSITGGTFTSAEGVNALKAYNFSDDNKTEGPWTEAGDVVSVSGGSFSSAVPENLCADGLVPAEDGDGGYTVAVSKSSNVSISASDGSLVGAYDTIAAAIAAAPEGSAITLLADVCEDVVISSGETITIDLAGHTLTNVADHTITNNGTLTITDSVGSGVIDNVTNGRAAVRNEVGATATLDAGSYTRSKETGSSPEVGGANTHYNIVNHGTMTMNEDVVVRQDGAFSSLIENGWYSGGENTNNTPAIMTINGGSYSGGINTIKNDDWGELTINGGSFTNTTQAAVLNWNKATINDGEFISQQYVVLNGKIDDIMDKGELVITGGTFVGGNGFDAIDQMGGSQKFGTAKVTGGTFSASPIKRMEPGAVVRVNGDGTFTALEKKDLGPGTYQTVDGDELDQDDFLSGLIVTVDPETGEVTAARPVTPPAQTGEAVSVKQPEDATIKVSPSRAEKGDAVTVTVTPDEGREVTSVTVTDEDGRAVAVKPGEKDGTWTFEMPDGAVTVTATTRCDGGELCPTHGLSDVEVGAWYHDGADWAVETGLMGGMGDGTFAPSERLSRAQLAAVLWNRAGNPSPEDAGAASSFVDTDANGFYAEALAWCVETGAFVGLDDTHFGPADAITREQLAVVLWRMADEPASDQDLSDYPDGSDVSAFADTAVRWAVENGVISGQGDGTLDPQGAIDRAQAAAIFQRLAE